MQGKNTVLITIEYGPKIRLGDVLTSVEIEPDDPFSGDLCDDCKRCIRACPTIALKPREIAIKRRMVYALKDPESTDVYPDVRTLTEKFTTLPTASCFMECTRRLDVCPIGRKTHGRLPAQA